MAKHEPQTSATLATPPLASVEAIERSAGPSQASSNSSGSNEVRAVTSAGAIECSEGPPRASSAPSEGSSVHEVASVGARSADRPPLGGTDPSGGSAVREATSVGAMSIWRFPDLSVRWWPVFMRNLLVWRKLALPSLVGNIAEPLMWLVAFGYGMGALVGEVSVAGSSGSAGMKVPYILFLASGSICMSAMNAASFEALYSAFSRMHVQKTWDGIMNAPVSLDSVLLAEMLWAAFKALFTVTAILGVMLALSISHSPKLLLAWPILLLVGMMFSCMALIFNALAKGYDFFTYYFTLVLTPMMFLSGVFFPREQLPSVVRIISDWLPLTNAVEIIRPLFLDQWPQAPWRHGLVLLVYTVLAFWVALALTRRRFQN